MFAIMTLFTTIIRSFSHLSHQRLMNYPLPPSSGALLSWLPFGSKFYGSRCVCWYLWFCLSSNVPCVSRSFPAFVCWSPIYNIDCCGRRFLSFYSLCWSLGGSTIFALPLQLHSLPIRTKLHRTYYTVCLVLHAGSLDMRLDCFSCLVFRVECDVAWRVVDPFDAEVGIDVEIVTNHFVAHVVNAKQIPCALA